MSNEWPGAEMDEAEERGFAALQDDMAAGGHATSLSRTLAQLLEDPRLTAPPEAIAERFAWRGRITLLSGREKAGKSTLAAWIAANVSRQA